MYTAANDLAKLEADLWHGADTLRANSGLASSQYFLPVLGILFLRHAANRFAAAAEQIAADQASGKMPPRPVLPADYIARRSLYLPESARYDTIMASASSGADLATLVIEAMTAIEESFPPLAGVLPKDYGIFEPKVLEDLMRIFNSEQIKRATGDMFGRIYEYFLAKFSIQKAYDNGEFFTPPSIVQTIVNVIEPDHGIVFDPAAGSGGMFVQSSHFIEHEGEDPAQKVIFYGQEKNAETIRIAQMNLAVHGLEGNIGEAITYYADRHELVGKCDYVMANPPFNVDEVDAERIGGDPRLPFGLPGINKDKKVSNANYLWISYFYSYLNPKGRAGFVMSSQASSAGNDEKTVRRKIIETGDVDVIIAIRPGFFYTRQVPCELWFFDRNKPAERHDQVLMLDARNVFQKMTRTVNEFSPEQARNLAAIIWLYRGQQDRFLALVRDYLDRLCASARAIPEAVAVFEQALAPLSATFHGLRTAAEQSDLAQDQKDQVLGAIAEFDEAFQAFQADRTKVLETTAAFVDAYAATLVANDAQHAARANFDPLAESLRGLNKQMDMLYKLAARVPDRARASSLPFDRAAATRLLKELELKRTAATEQLHDTVYVHRQVAWLHERFPAAQLQPVLGLVKLVDRKEIETADWSLSPGRHVGVAPIEEDEDFDFEQAIRDIHTELADLNQEAADLGAQIQDNLVELAL